ncbi:MAG: methylmalonyl-CoA mutase [Candidatus Lokiarchaeota archaeon]|nr:methylmalonyl-CoA mutase [Candidatus Lokiarchaeota archaeon]MBD3201876.1 methylmalonyl-CoA mutase [Candidatus Lokiarchaeota archaeon]
MSEKRRIKVLVAKPGLDGHDRGAKVVARGLRDAGMEVIYTGLHQTPNDIANTIIQEDPDAVLLSILSGAHNALCPKIMDTLKEKGIDDVLIAVGGIIPEEDKDFLRKHGLEGFYGPGTEIKEIVEFVKNNLKR